MSKEVYDEEEVFIPLTGKKVKLRFPRIKFRCIVCGKEGWNKDWVRYSDPDKHIKAKSILLREYSDSPIHLEALRRSKHEYFYNFTVCHGIFVRVE